VYGGVDRFDPQSKTWTNLPSKPLAVYDAQAAVINGLIYVPGGYTDGNMKEPTNKMEVFDTTTNNWSIKASLPTPLSGYGLVAFEGQLFVFGGWDGKQYRNTVYSYDPTSDSWQERTPMPTARAYPGVAEAAGRIYVIGGVYDMLPVNANEIYSPYRDLKDSNPWEDGFPIPEDRLGVKAVTIADTIYVFGGEPDQINRQGLIYFPQTDVWQSLEAAPKSLGEYFGMTSIGTNLFFVGGVIDSNISDQNIAYQAIITLSIPIIIK
jgi:N-acetylneuraminic acid mutarotase